MKAFVDMTPDFVSERFCCDGRCNDNQGRGDCPGLRYIEPIESVEKESRWTWFVYLLGFIAGWAGSALARTA